MHTTIIVQFSLLALSLLFLTCASLPPINMIGPMTGPGQVSWDADLGVPLVWNGGTWFLEGDCLVGGNHGPRVAGNAIGGCKPLPCKVEWYLQSNGNPFMYIQWPPKVLSCVPAGSCQANGNAYIWQMNVVDWGTGAPGTVDAWSMLLRGTPTPANFVASPTLYFEVNSKFVNAAPVVTPNGTIYFYGTGKYRASPVYLASIDAPNMEVKTSWGYYTGSSWALNNESAAAPIIKCMSGEISAIYSTYLKQYVITAFDFTSGVILKMYRSDTPTGPWSEEEIFSETIKYPWLQGMSGAYGGYMVPDQGVNTPILYMTLSFWVPYRTYMVQTDLSKLGTGQFFVGATDIKKGETYDSVHPYQEQVVGEEWDLSCKNDLHNRTKR